MTDLKLPEEKTKAHYIPEENIKVHFANAQIDNDLSEVLVNAIDKARQSVYAQFYLFEIKKLMYALIRAAQREVKVQLILDGKKASKYKDEVSTMLNFGVKVIISNKNRKMHNKILVIDSYKTITGSYNPEDYENDDNLIVIKDPGLAAEFIRNWELTEKYSII